MSEQELIRNNILEAVKGWQPIVDRHQAEADLQKRLDRELNEERYFEESPFYPGEESGKVELWD